MLGNHRKSLKKSTVYRAQDTDIFAEYFQGRVDELTGRLVVDAHDPGDFLVAEMVRKPQVDGLLLPGAQVLIARL